jgi:tRNA pseudouridine13 synthase
VKELPGTLPEWARAFGEPVCKAEMRSEPEDFVVEEELGFSPDGAGEHDFHDTWKTGANTAWVARQLARHAGVSVRDVGYSGLKDRHAHTRQTFSVRRPNREGTDWTALHVDGIEIVQIARHSKKLRRGAHRSNRFQIRLRGMAMSADVAALEDRLAIIAANGVPNYFGEQRFGRDGGNLDLANRVLAGQRVNRDKRSIAISAARSFYFNEALDQRVRGGTWDRILPGDVANLDGSNSVFDVDQVDDELERRCVEMDIHPTAALPGIETLNVKAGTRSLRLPVRLFTWEFESGGLLLRFMLPRGGYATAVIREIVSV